MGCRVAHVLINEVEAAITRHECSNFLAVFNELGTHALTNGGVRLLGLNATAKWRNMPSAQQLAERSAYSGQGSHFLKNDSLAVR